MSFWSGETLAKRLPELIEPFHESRIDCAAYTLRVGPEVYVSPSRSEQASSASKVQLAEGEGFPIPGGQFAILLTEEHIRVPASAVAFISMKSTIKFKGLVNVSGFHVDPGYHGRLLFSVFNAGPRPVHLARGEDCFLIWYASLDNERSEMVKTKAGFNSIPSRLINPIAGEVQSFEGLLERIRSTEEHLSKRMQKIDRNQGIILYVLPPLLAVALTLMTMRACAPAANVRGNDPATEQPAQLIALPSVPLEPGTPAVAPSQDPGP